MKLDALLEKMCANCPLPERAGFKKDPLNCLYNMAPLRYKEQCLAQGAQYVADYITTEGIVIRLLEMVVRKDNCEPCLLSPWCNWHHDLQRQYIIQVFQPHEYWYGIEKGQNCVVQCKVWFLSCVKDRASAQKKLEEMANEFGWKILDGNVQEALQEI